MRALVVAVVLIVVAAPGWTEEPKQPAAPSAEALLSGAEWAAFCERIKAAGRFVLDEQTPKTELEIAEGYRYLLAMLASEIDVALYQTDLDDPQLRYALTRYRGEAMPSSDARYVRFEVDGNGVYRLSGKLGNSQHTTLQAYSGVAALDTIDLTDVVDADGSFSITIGGPALEKRWFPLAPQTEMIQLREYFADWDNARFTQLIAEKLDRKPRGTPVSAEKMAVALHRATEGLDRRVPFWKQRLGAIRDGHDNSVSPAKTLGDVGLGGLYYGEGWFDLEADEALIIELDPPDAAHWSFQLGNYWGEWIDFANFTSSSNGHQAKRSSDAKVRLVIAHSDPGVPNWLDTAGHGEGVILYRYHKPKSNPVPTTKRVKLAELRMHLPGDTPVVTPTQRRAEIDARRAHTERRWRP